MAIKQQSKANAEAAIEIGETAQGHEDIRRVLEEDPLVRFVRDRWRALLVVILFVGAAFYVRTAFHETNEKALQTLADLYANIRSEYQLIQGREASLPELSADSSEEGRRKFAEAQQQVKDARAALLNAANALKGEKQPYATIGDLYAGLLGQDIRGAGEVDSSKAALVSELEALLRAKKLLDFPETRIEGRDALKTLAEQSQFVHAVAALSLSMGARGTEERDIALKTLEHVRGLHPEQSDLLSPEILRLGGE